ncbi:dual specificity phosphatase [Colletotrichum sojae]|uniref:Dual specificity phosphatase n=1 Tax=Colletotrichum sojae TaxID=2175907 RepID=A0A8H6JJE1_9PEZI|nr:dual specificity phosphatase [Colletotrichum sojae]
MAGPLANSISSVIAAAPYSARPPSPPYINIPMNPADATLVPSYDNMDSMHLTSDDLNIITRNRHQVARDRSVEWSYESRRQAQSILDFLYLGPMSVARDADWVHHNGITLILVVRHSRVAQARLMSVDKVAQSLGIAVEYLDVADNGELIRTFPDVVRKINNHLLEVYRWQALGKQENGMLIDGGNFRGGKVLIVCETGNDRSALVAAAYIMAMYNEPMIKSVQYVSVQRFSANFDEDGKRMLMAYEDILTAQKNVSSATRHIPRGGQLNGQMVKEKRGIEDTLDEEDWQKGAGYAGFLLDRERYEDRGKFSPFIDASQ